MHTYQDYQAEIIRVKQSYLEDKIKFNWDYTYQEEETEHGYYLFIISNRITSTIIKYDKELNYMNTSNISRKQLKICQQLMSEMEQL